MPSAERDSQCEFLLASFGVLGQSLQERQALLEMTNRLQVCRALHGSLARALPVGNRCALETSLRVVVSDPLWLLLGDLGKALLQHARDLCVDLSASALEE
jgi:hypothetical protein